MQAKSKKMKKKKVPLMIPSGAGSSDRLSLIECLLPSWLSEHEIESGPVIYKKIIIMNAGRGVHKCHQWGGRHLWSVNGAPQTARD